VFPLCTSPLWGRECLLLGTPALPADSPEPGRPEGSAPKETMEFNDTAMATTFVYSLKIMLEVFAHAELPQ